MLPLFRSELFRLHRRWMARVLVLLMILGVAGVYAILWLVVATQEGADRASAGADATVVAARDVGLGITIFFASIFTVIMSASIIGTEYGWGTIRALLPRARSRLSLIVAKLLALVVFDVVLVVVGFLVALGMSSLITVAEALDDDLGEDVVIESLLALGRSTYTLLPYSMLAFFIAVLTRSNAAGIAIGIVVLFAESIVLQILTSIFDAVEWMRDVFFTANMSAITDLNDGSRDDFELPEPWMATAVLALWIVAFAVASIFIFRRRDVTSGA